MDFFVFVSISPKNDLKYSLLYVHSHIFIVFLAPCIFFSSVVVGEGRKRERKNSKEGEEERKEEQ